MAGDAQAIELSLVSHTNAGKTTLARTLLRRDIGAVRDEPHVTEVAESHELVATPGGDRLVLWDTPGFGDSARLARRLARDGTALGWFLSHVWDRLADRAFHGSQQALRNVRDASNLVLYVANASEDPESAGYVDPEMQILGWIGRPIVVLLNQVGASRGWEEDAADAARWRQHLSRWPLVRAVLVFDAFARCWVQEDGLLARLEPLLDADQRPAFARLREAWATRNREVLDAAVRVLAEQLAVTAADIERIGEARLVDRVRGWVAERAGAAPPPAVLAGPMRALAERLVDRSRAATQSLIALHGLAGRAADELADRGSEDFRVARPVDPARAGLLGGLASGALTGLAADLATGGLSFGAGAIVGGVLGALGAGGLTHAWNVAAGVEEGSVRWSPAFLDERIVAAVLRYLAVAHFGRGRGEFVAGEPPPHWRRAAEAATAAEQTVLAPAWLAAREGADAAALQARLEPVIRRILQHSLARLYPDAVPALDAAAPAPGNGAPREGEPAQD